MKSITDVFNSRMLKQKSWKNQKTSYLKIYHQMRKRRARNEKPSWIYKTTTSKSKSRVRSEQRGRTFI